MEFDLSLRMNVVVVGPVTAHVMDLLSNNLAVAGVIEPLDVHNM